MTYRVIITGSRKYEWKHRVWAYLDAMLAYHPDLLVVHGGCLSGADAWAQAWATEHNSPTEVHPADWDTHERSAGPIRNSEMANGGAEQCGAFWLPTHDRKVNRGTRDMCTKAWRAGIPVLMAFGDVPPSPWTGKLVNTFGKSVAPYRKQS